jgi:type IV secretion system protein VirD4
VLNQIGRRLTEGLEAARTRRPLLLMLDEFPALGRLDFFEASLAFMAGYRIKAFLIAQSLNQIERAYGPNHSILDNCHVRVAFATNDERTARRISDTLGTATEMRAMANYAGHRLSPWLGHLMVSRQETARQLLTPGEVMQLPAHEAVILVAGAPPIRATKIRYYADPRLAARVCVLDAETGVPRSATGDDWKEVSTPTTPGISKSSSQLDEGGLKRQPELDGAEEISTEPDDHGADVVADAEGDEMQQGQELQRRFTGTARQVAMDRDDGIPLGDDA